MSMTERIKVVRREVNNCAGILIVRHELDAAIADALAEAEKVDALTDDVEGYRLRVAAVEGELELREAENQRARAAWLAVSAPYKCTCHENPTECDGCTRYYTARKTMDELLGEAPEVEFDDD